MIEEEKVYMALGSMLCLVALIIVASIINLIQLDKTSSNTKYVDWSDTLTTTTVETTTTIATTRRTTTRIVQTVPTASYSEYQLYASEYSSYDIDQMNCLINLWNKESGWNPNAVNRSSGACGIPQALPCSKIANSEGDNSWQSQIRWGIKYINARYGNACNAWQHFQEKNWY